MLDEKVPEAGEIAGVKDDYSTIWISDLTSDEHPYGADPLLAHLATRTLDGIVASESADPDDVIELLGGGAWAIHRRLHPHFLSRCAHSESVLAEIVERHHGRSAGLPSDLDTAALREVERHGRVAA